MYPSDEEDGTVVTSFSNHQGDSMRICDNAIQDLVADILDEERELIYENGLIEEYQSRLEFDYVKQKCKALAAGEVDG